LREAVCDGDVAGVSTVTPAEAVLVEAALRIAATVSPAAGGA